MRNLLAWVCFFTCAHCIQCGAQAVAVKDLQFEVLDLKDGLSQGMINCIMQDHAGFMWFATKDGLNRYDGYRFTVFRHNPDDSNTIADNYIRYVFEDSKARLWVGTASKGLDIMDVTTEKFTHLIPNAAGVNSFTGNNVENITEDKKGNIWITDKNGLTVAVEQPSSRPGKPAFTFTQVEKQSVKAFCAADGRLWVSRLSGCLYTISGYGTTKQRTDTIPTNQYCWYQPGAKGAVKFVKAFEEDPVNHIMYLVMDNCITRVDEKKHLFGIKRTNETIRFGYSPYGGISDGTVWLSRDFEVYQMQTATGEIFKIKSSGNAAEYGVKSATCFYTDHSGIIWIGTGGYGVLKHNPATEKINPVICGAVASMQPDKDGSVLMVKYYGVLCSFDKKTGAQQDLLPAYLARQLAGENGMAYFDFALAGKDKTYWLSKRRLIQYNAITKKITNYNRAAFPLFNSTNGMLWFGSDSTFCSYNYATRQFTDYRYPIPDPGAPYFFIQAIYEDADGIFWLGTTNGLLRFDKDRQQWKHYVNNPNNGATLSFDLIFSLLPDPLQPEKYLWVGTNGGGLNRFNKQTGQVTRYSVKNGLSNDVVYGILSDNEGNLWMSTNYGIARLNIKTGRFRNYTMQDGLQGNEFNRNAFCKTADGTLFFGGVNGFNYFNPSTLHDNAHVPALAFTSFRIGNKTVDFNDPKSPLAKSVNLTDKIVLPYADNMISFDFAALDFTAPEKNQYRYRLEGFDKEWINAGNVHTATYTNLDPGNYTLYVTASNNDGVWNEQGRKMLLVILPPWYMTWWLRTLAVAAVCGALYAFYRYRLNQALKLVAVRNRIATDLHDEIGSNLSNISIFSEVAQQKGGDNAALLQKISRYTSTSMEAMSDIVWMVNARNDRFENIVSRMRYLAAEVLEAKDYSVHINIDDKLNSLALGMELRKNFYLVYKEAINNIAKYAGGKNAWVSMHVNNQQLVLTVKDDGKGFSMQAASQGNGLRNMQKRAENIKGRLQVDSSPGNGTCVTLQFKI